MHHVFFEDIMKALTVICNIVLFGFTCLVLVTDGAPKETSYIVFTLLVVLVPILNVVVLLRSGVGDGWVVSHKKGKPLETQVRKTGLINKATSRIEKSPVNGLHESRNYYLV